jgi:prophage regulatory protein
MGAQFMAKSEVVEHTRIRSGSNSGISGSSEEVIFLRLPDVKAVTGLSKSSLYELIRANRFPAPVRLGPRVVAWVRSEVKQWAAERILSSRSATSLQDSRLMPRSALRPTLAPSKRRA